MVVGTARGVDDERFAFGQNWRDFSLGVDEQRLAAARAGVARLLGTDDLRGCTFLDVGCGSGLMSLAAHCMGAQVTSFDHDPESVATTVTVRDRYAGADAYPVLQGSALDEAFVRGLGTFDVVYSWGVLHHTGDMWRAFAVVVDAVGPGGTLALAVYNDQGLPSRVWREVKRAYVERGPVTRQALVGAADLWFRGRDVLSDALALRHGRAELRRQRAERRDRARGMDRRHDLVDWVGGHPFEVARPDEVFRWFRDRGFVLVEMTTVGAGLACNEFVFLRSAG